MSTQEASIFFFLPIIAAYLSACGGWLLITRQYPSLWITPSIKEQKRNFKDIGIAFLAVAGILLLGQIYRSGFLLPTTGESWIFRLNWIIDNLIIYSPIFIVLYLRKQSTSTIFLSMQGFVKKVSFGLGLGILAVIIFLTLRSQLGQFPEVILRSIEPGRLVDFVPIFLEGVAVAFLFVRIKWALGIIPAILIPAALFALSHIPGQLANGLNIVEITAFFVVNSGLAGAIIYFVHRSADIIWIGLVHYIMDIAIEAI